MGSKSKANCTICGKPYDLCISCKGSMSRTPWKYYADTPEHYKIYQILNGRFLGIYTTEEAKERLEKVDLSDIDTFYDNIKKEIKEILSYKNVNDENK